MKKIDCDQRSPEWLQARLGIVTASEMDNLVSPKKWEIKKGEGPATYLAKKLAEKWTGAPIETFNGGAMEQGTIKEGEAIPTFEWMLGVKVEKVGFVTTDDGRVGCSPDGLIAVDGVMGGFELKCPLVHTHAGYLIAGELPSDYSVQVQGSMLVTGAPWWKFVSFCRGFPPLILTVQRNEEQIAVLREAIDAFNARFDAAYEKLLDMNGGPPQRNHTISTDENESVIRTLDGVSPSAIDEFLRVA